MVNTVLLDLSSLIQQRRKTPAEASYTRQLLDSGIERCAQKFGEEAIETIIAALHQTDTEFMSEAADLLFHLLVLLESRSLNITSVLQILKERQGQSGLAEKTSRTK